MIDNYWFDTFYSTLLLYINGIVPGKLKSKRIFPVRLVGYIDNDARVQVKYFCFYSGVNPILDTNRDDAG